jgi:hypothetical protein
LGAHRAAPQKSENTLQFRAKIRALLLTLGQELWIHAKTKNWEEAICVAREITQRAPKLPFGWIHLAYSLHELRRNADIRIMPRRSHACLERWAFRRGYAA